MHARCHIYSIYPLSCNSDHNPTPQNEHEKIHKNIAYIMPYIGIYLIYIIKNICVEVELGKCAAHAPFQVGRANYNSPCCCCCCWSLGAPGAAGAGWGAGWLGGWLAGWLAGLAGLAGWLGWLAAWGWGWPGKVHEYILGKLFKNMIFWLVFDGFLCFLLVLNLVFFVLPPCAQIGIFCVSSLCSNYYFLCFLLVLKLWSSFLISCAEFGIFCASSLC